MLVTGYPGSIWTHIYIFAVESQQPVGATHTSCTQLLWKPHVPIMEDTPIYLLTFENSHPWGKEHFMYAVTEETPRSGQARHAHLSNYRGNRKNVYACVL
jgi:hypothetical protein